MSKIKILALAGSTRKDSNNKRFLRSAAQAAEGQGAEVTFVDLAELPLPLYDGDLEETSGLPENAVRLKQLMAESDAFIIASPEYNASVSAVLKNAIDWTSRPGAVDHSVWDGKFALLLAASPGGLGGLRGLGHLREILGNLGTITHAKQQALPQSHLAFEADGRLKDSDVQVRLDNLVAEFLEIAKRFPSALSLTA